MVASYISCNVGGATRNSGPNSDVAMSRFRSHPSVHLASNHQAGMMTGPSAAHAQPAEPSCPESEAAAHFGSTGTVTGTNFQQANLVHRLIRELSADEGGHIPERLFVMLNNQVKRAMQHDLATMLSAPSSTITMATPRRHGAACWNAVSHGPRHGNWQPRQSKPRIWIRVCCLCEAVGSRRAQNPVADTNRQFPPF